MIRIRDWMSAPVLTIHPEETVADACKLMAKHNFGSLVVSEEKAPLGIITERDVINRVVGKGKDPKKILIKDAMTKEVLTTDINATFLDVSKLMESNRYRRMVIMEAGAIAGIVTARDILRIVSG